MTWQIVVNCCNRQKSVIDVTVSAVLLYVRLIVNNC